MSPVIKNTLAVILGIVGGSIINGAIISISSQIIPPPTGADITTMEGLKASMHLFQPRHFLMPFLAHALGTFTGVFIPFKLAVSHHFKMALTVSIFFLAGGIANVFLLPSPVWFTFTDLTFAYIPMAYLVKILLKK